MTVPGGVGGGDSKLFQAMVEPDEQIDITPNRGAQGSGGSASKAPAVFNLTVGAASARDFLRSLIEDINGMTADGYRLNVA
ncbi:hypothetical protein AOQ72_04110 [Bradyrhizobium yuanmingense]|uniref:Uncharacterized protein n=1 Tax=Bradyrhizobium yuanmingense TaxID=108015 RepID=A0A0R3BKA0_9BRAD|nr:hypothetical protein [Bradyrhizobium yuanmingense]KRP85834.1 hypothetical protein AOQ72_04110 [Bradyrhizobium yuanmingense]